MKLLACSASIALACMLGASSFAQSPDPRPATPFPEGSHYIEREFRMPVPGSGLGIDVLEVYINSPGKHPLALLTHGTSDKPEERLQLTPWAQLSQALWFARRGYVALVIIRRGYGLSGGQQDGTHGGCRTSGGSFEESGEASADDLRAAVDYAAKQLPEADTATVVSAGVSTGGFAQVALAAKPPAGLKAAIDFAGGRGGDGKGDLCNESALIDAYKSFGKKARVPMLWLYSENDKWFPPPFARKFQAAFESKGGVDEFILVPADGDDGHHYYAHVAAWSPLADTFLHAHQLPTVDPPYPLPPAPKVDPPTALHDRGLEAFKNFLILGPRKAFAVNPNGVYGFSVGHFNQQMADQQAMENCSKNLKPGAAPCQIVARGNDR